MNNVEIFSEKNLEAKIVAEKLDTKLQYYNTTVATIIL